MGDWTFVCVSHQQQTKPKVVYIGLMVVGVSLDFGFIFLERELNFLKRDEDKSLFWDDKQWWWYLGLSTVSSTFTNRNLWRWSWLVPWRASFWNIPEGSKSLTWLNSHLVAFNKLTSFRSFQIIKRFPVNRFLSIWNFDFDILFLQAFQFIDSDKDGFISKADINATFDSLGMYGAPLEHTSMHSTNWYNLVGSKQNCAIIL